jgi:hypothetical protein
MFLALLLAMSIATSLVKAAVPAVPCHDEETVDDLVRDESAVIGVMVEEPSDCREMADLRRHRRN